MRFFSNTFLAISSRLMERLSAASRERAGSGQPGAIAISLWSAGTLIDTDRCAAVGKLPGTRHRPRCAPCRRRQSATLFDGFVGRVHAWVTGSRARQNRRAGAPEDGGAQHGRIPRRRGGCCGVRIRRCAALSPASVMPCAAGSRWWDAMQPVRWPNESNQGPVTRHSQAPRRNNSHASAAAGLTRWRRYRRTNIRNILAPATEIPFRHHRQHHLLRKGGGSLRVAATTAPSRAARQAQLNPPLDAVLYQQPGDQ